MTGRLIDADAIEHCLVIGGRRHGKAIISEFIRRAIQTAPTVDAIPVEWVKKWIADHYDWDFVGEPKYISVVEYMFEDWQKEQRKEE